MVFFDFFKAPGKYYLPLVENKKEKMKAQIAFLSLLNPKRKSDKALTKLLQYVTHITFTQ
jgi:hypothetical protein